MNLKDNMHNLADEFGDLATHAGHLAARSARLAKRSVVEPGLQATRMASHGMRSATPQGRALAATEIDRCFSFARHNPLATALMVGAAGLVVGLALGIAGARQAPPSEGDQSDGG